VRPGARPNVDRAGHGATLDHGFGDDAEVAAAKISCCRVEVLASNEVGFDSEAVVAFKLRCSSNLGNPPSPVRCTKAREHAMPAFASLRPDLFPVSPPGSSSSASGCCRPTWTLISGRAASHNTDTQRILQK
jgi:hypothetical protein